MTCTVPPPTSSYMTTPLITNMVDMDCFQFNVNSIYKTLSDGYTNLFIAVQATLKEVSDETGSILLSEILTGKS